MKSKQVFTLGTTLLTLSLPLLTGCPVTESSSSTAAADTSTTTTSSGSGAGGTLTTSDLLGFYDSACLAIGSMGGPSGYTYYRDYLGITAGGNFDFERNYFTNSSCTSSDQINSGLYGTYAVGAVVSASSSYSNITFTATSANIRAYTAASRTVVNNACSLALTTTATASVTGNTCPGYIAHAAASATSKNIVGLSGSTTGSTLSLGAFATDLLIPGVITGATTPSTIGVTFTKR